MKIFVACLVMTRGVETKMKDSSEFRIPIFMTAVTVTTTLKCEKAHEVEEYCYCVGPCTKT